MQNYFTIKGVAEACFEIKRSRFLAHIAAVESVAAAKEFVTAQKKKYYDARHNPYAYVLGDKGSEQKSNDDGEPAGTAGSPILESLVKRRLTNVVAVVTRYFGGIKLGAGGLTRAYGHSTLLGIDAAEILVALWRTPLLVTVDYSLLAMLEHWCIQKKITVSDKNYEDQVTLTLLLPSENKDELKRELTDLTAGSARCASLPAKCVLLPLEKT